MWKPWWTSPKRGRGNVNSLLPCSIFVHCWHFFFLTSLVSRCQKERWASFGTMHAAVTHGAPTILVLKPTYHSGYTATVQDTRIKQDSRKNCCASRSTCHCGHHGVFAVQDSCCSLFARAWWWIMFAQCGRSIATLFLPSTTCFKVESLCLDSAATLTQDSALLLQSCEEIGLSIVMLCSWTVDGVQTTAASNVLQLWQVALYNIRILRPTLLGLDRNIPMYSSWTCASSLVEFVTWLYWIWFLGFCKSNTGDFWRNEWLHCENSRKNRPRNALLRSAIWPHRLSLWDDQVLLDPQLAFGPVSSVECLCNALWHWIPFNTLIGWPIHCAFIHGWVIH